MQGYNLLEIFLMVIDLCERWLKIGWKSINFAKNLTRRERKTKTTNGFFICLVPLLPNSLKAKFSQLSSKCLNVSFHSMTTLFQREMSCTKRVLSLRDSCLLTMPSIFLDLSEMGFDSFSF